MNVQNIKDALPEYAKDLKLNVGNVLTPEGAPGLSEQQIAAVALATAIASRNVALRDAIEAHAAERLDAAHVSAARAAAAIMGMNNIYYRFTHLVANDEYAKMQAKLRMTVIGNPGVDKVDFELYSLAVSAINGCGACVSAHEAVVRKAGVSAEGVQSAIRIAAVMHGVAVALESASPNVAARAAA